MRLLKGKAPDATQKIPADKLSTSRNIQKLYTGAADDIKKIMTATGVTQ